MENKFDASQALNALKGQFAEAEAMLKDGSKIDELLVKIEEKLKTVPAIGEKLADLPVMIALVKSYAKKEYDAVPVGSVVAIVGAFLYLLSRHDIVSDSIPLLGLVDDVAVIAVCMNLIDKDLKAYEAWRDAQKAQ